jgi:hypothetical protein
MTVFMSLVSSAQCSLWSRFSGSAHRSWVLMEATMLTMPTYLEEWGVEGVEEVRWRGRGRRIVLGGGRRRMRG